MSQSPIRCLVLGCGNTLRGDDGVGPWLCAWLEQQFAGASGVRVIARQQWTPELAEDIVSAESVIFIDCAIGASPGEVALDEIEPASGTAEIATHHLGAPELLALARDLYNAVPRHAAILTIGAGSTELGEHFSDAVTAALPRAQLLLEATIRCSVS